MATDQELAEQMGRVWRSLADAGRPLTEAEWKTATEVPGWSVQDNLAHVTALEWQLLGRPELDHQVADDLPHVRNDFGRTNEVFVDSRRSWTGADVLAEFEAVTGDRLAALAALDADGFGSESWTPVGPGTVRDLLPFRIFDAWVHEQDMRRAVGRPGDLDGPVAAAAMQRILDTLPFVVGKKAAAPDGATVVVDLAPPLAARVAVVVDGRARPVEPVPEQPSVRIAMDGETYARLACGRLDPAPVLAGDRVRLEGDATLGRRVVEELNFLF